jgi:TrpR-related protein YerC/YecD
MNWSKNEYDRLVQAVLTVRTSDEAKNFLRDLMTEKEIDEFAKRFKTAEMLTRKIPYSIIEKETGLSSATVARVAKWLNGQEGGYRLVIDRLHHTDETTVA